MVNFCVVLGCSNRSNREKDNGYYRIPPILSRSKPKKQALSVERRATWLALSRRRDLAADTTEFYRVCGDHFISGEPSSISDKTNPDWAPNQNLGYDFRGVSASSQERYERAQERSEKRRRGECASALLELSHQSTDDMLVKADASPSVEEKRVKDCQSEITND
ncbi:PREDICTED: uncharacterized protein LOC107355746 [Acropora digitifera]|uniref:uncharacterized protein LOC107355746 n=1 Tax=Acropora digitifera TaxID=70779 RepID=UPI00077A8C91|nr:PREDICTED: uncharacterized protein LOC107355746 [Acropora digitifera]